jgi:hypothetical protein
VAIDKTGVIPCERRRSYKASTAAAWGSTEKFRTNWDAIFRPAPKDKCDDCPHKGAREAALFHLETITTGANVHRLAQIKQCLVGDECDQCRDAVKRALQEING